MHKPFLPSKRYFIAYKPYGMLCQFSPDGSDKPVLGELFPFPKDVYSVGRLDTDSEGLLLLTNDKQVNHRFLNPAYGHWRQYWVQVEGMPDKQALQQLANGVSIKVGKKACFTQPAKVAIIEQPETLPERTPPIRYRKHIPTTWLSLELTEGKNRQVRRMTAAVGYPTLRLVRCQMAKLSLAGLQPGQVKELNQEEALAALFG